MRFLNRKFSGNPIPDKQQNRIAQVSILLLLFAAVLSCGCRNQEPMATLEKPDVDQPAVELVPVPKTPDYVRGTNDPQLVVFLELLIEMDSTDKAFELIHNRCLPALQAPPQRDDCDRRLRKSLQFETGEILFVSPYDGSQKLWDSAHYASVVKPELIVSVNQDWAKTEFPFEAGLTKWLLAKSDGDWRIVMPALVDPNPVEE